MFPPLLVCREILDQREVGAPLGGANGAITPLKLIKLAYISHGFHLGYLSKPLLNENVEAWKYGPVVESIYLAVSHFGRKAIMPELFAHIEGELDGNAEKVISAVMRTYNKYDGLELSTLTHQKGTPWDETVKEHGYHTVIKNALIEKHYKRIINGEA